MKVLHLLASRRFSGAENVVCQIINMFAEDAGVEMVYCSPDGQIREALAEKGIPFLPLEKLSISQVKKAINEFNPDVIHAHDVKASLLAALTCKKIKMISHIHVNNMESSIFSVKTLLYSFAANKAQHIFWVSQSAFDGFRMTRKIAKKSTVLKNVIDIKAVQEKCRMDQKEYSFDVVYVGRLTAQKNPERLMQVSRILADKKPNIQIAVAGTGEMEEQTKELCKTLDLQNNVEFVGFMNNPNKLLQSAKVMIMTSLFEGTPMVALEAMALGVPIVSTPVDGMCDLIEHDFNGYLCGDDVDFAEAVIAICEDDAKRQRLSQNTMKRAMEINDIAPYREQIKNRY